jgi:hypothetical protein
MGAACTGLDGWLRIQGSLPQHPINRPRQSATVASAIGHKGPPILATGKARRDRAHLRSEPFDDFAVD